MNPNDSNVVLLETVAENLGEALLDQVVFVGGAIAGLLITDPAMPDIRPTQDVDLICSATVLADYYRIGEQLRHRGFTEDQRPGAPICRWRFDELAVDVMPITSDILGFSNRWYPLAMESAVVVWLPSARSIRLVSAPVFIATKLEAFDGRGNRDFLFSHDLEDLIAVVDGRDTLLQECRAGTSELRAYLATRFKDLLSTPAFVEALPAHLPGDTASQKRLPRLIQSLKDLTTLHVA